MTFEVESFAQGGRWFVVPRGELDLSTQSRLHTAITQLIIAGHLDLVVDLDEVTFLDSTGLGALIAARRKLHALRGTFALVCANEPVERIFRATHLTKVFTIYDSREAAIRPAASP